MNYKLIIVCLLVSLLVAETHARRTRRKPAKRPVARKAPTYIRSPYIRSPVIRPALRPKYKGVKKVVIIKRAPKKASKKAKKAAKKAKKVKKKKKKAAKKKAPKRKAPKRKAAKKMAPKKSKKAATKAKKARKKAAKRKKKATKKAAKSKKKAAKKAKKARKKATKKAKKAKKAAAKKAKKAKKAAAKKAKKAQKASKKANKATTAATAAANAAPTGAASAGPTCCCKVGESGVEFDAAQCIAQGSSCIAVSCGAGGAPVAPGAGTPVDAAAPFVQPQAPFLQPQPGFPQAHTGGGAPPHPQFIQGAGGFAAPPPAAPVQVQGEPQEVNLNVNVQNSQHASDASKSVSVENSADTSKHESEHSSKHEASQEVVQKSEHFSTSAPAVVVVPPPAQPQVVIIDKRKIPNREIILRAATTAPAPGGCVREARNHCGFAGPEATLCRECYMDKCSPCTAAWLKVFAGLKLKPENDADDDHLLNNVPKLTSGAAAEPQHAKCDLKAYAGQLSAWRIKREAALVKCDSAGDPKAVDACIRQCVSDFYESRPVRPSCAAVLAPVVAAPLVIHRSCARIKEGSARARCLKARASNRYAEASPRVQRLHQLIDNTDCSNYKTFSQRYQCRQARLATAVKVTQRKNKPTKFDCTGAFAAYKFALHKYRKKRAKAVNKCRKEADKAERRACLSDSLARLAKKRHRIKAPKCRPAAGDATCRKRLAAHDKRVAAHDKRSALEVARCKHKQDCVRAIVAERAVRRERLVRPACSRQHKRGKACRRATKEYRQRIEAAKTIHEVDLIACEKDLACILDKRVKFKDTLRSIALPSCAPRASETLRALRRCSRHTSEKARASCRRAAKHQTRAVPSGVSRRRRALKRCRAVRGSGARRACRRAAALRFPRRLLRAQQSVCRRELRECPEGNDGCECRRRVVTRCLTRCTPARGSRARRCRRAVHREVRRVIAQSYRTEVNRCQYSSTAKQRARCKRDREQTYLDLVLRRRHQRRARECAKLQSAHLKKQCLSDASRRWSIIQADSQCRLKHSNAKARRDCFSGARKRACGSLKDDKQRAACNERRRRVASLTKHRRLCRQTLKKTKYTKQEDKQSELRKCYAASKKAVGQLVVSCRSLSGEAFRQCIETRVRKENRVALARRSNELKRCKTQDCEFISFVNLRETELLFRRFRQSASRCKRGTRSLKRCVKKAYRAHVRRGAAFNSISRCGLEADHTRRAKCRRNQLEAAVANTCPSRSKSKSNSKPAKKSKSKKCAQQMRKFILEAFEEHDRRFKQHAARAACNKDAVCLKAVRKNSRAEDRVARALARCDALRSASAVSSCKEAALGGDAALPARQVLQVAAAARTAAAQDATGAPAGALEPWVAAVIMGGAALLALVSVLATTRYT